MKNENTFSIDYIKNTLHPETKQNLSLSSYLHLNNEVGMDFNFTEYNETYEKLSKLVKNNPEIFVQKDLNIVFRCQEMFWHAYDFVECTNAGKSKMTDIGWFIMTPSVVNLAFACEVYLKLIIVYYNVKSRKSHKLKELFESLPELIKTRVKFETMKNFGGMWRKPNCYEYLDNISDAFEKQRYIYEHDWNKSPSVIVETGFLETFCEVLRDITCRLVFRRSWDDHSKGW